MSSQSISPSHLGTTQPLPLLSRVILSAALTLVAWQVRHRSRRDLARLEPHQLVDIGLDPEMIRTELAKPFWRS